MKKPVLYKRKFYLPLFWKFAIALTISVIVFGTINYTLINENFKKTLESELLNRLNFITNTISEQLTNSLIEKDSSIIQTILSSARSSDSSIKFIILENMNNVVIASTYDLTMQDLINQNYKCSDSCKSMSEYPTFCHNERLEVIQANKPILKGSLGYLFVGLNIKNIEKGVQKNMRIFLIMILAFFVVGIFGAFVFSNYISKPIKRLDEYSQNFDLSNLPDETSVDFKKIARTNHFFEKFIVLDEIDNLISNFQRMVDGLISKHIKLQQMQTQLMQLEKMSTIGVLAAGLAHDINNPVAGILNSIYRLKRNPYNQEQLFKYLDLMEESAMKIQFVITNLMNFTRKQDISFTKVKLVEIIEKSLLLVSHRLSESNIKIKKNYKASNDDIFGSFQHLEQVFVNLLINSIEAIDQKFSEVKDRSEKEIRITVSDFSNSVEVIIEDNGIGIHQEDINKVFETFYTTKGSKGTGLGLSVVQNILNLHNAEIELHSDFGNGTWVKIKFSRVSQNERI